MKEFPGYTRKPFYYETDQMGIIHHANYIRWFEEARVAILDFMGMPYETIEAAGIIVPVLGVDCQYKGMVHFGDEVTIHVAITKYNGARLEMAYEVYNQDDQLVTTGSSQHCFLDSTTKRLIRLSKNHPVFHQLFKDQLKA